MMPVWLDDFLWTYQNVVYALGINGLLALSMYVVLAVGQLSLGQAAFMGMGAYSSALLTLKLHLPFAVVLPAATIPPVLFALAIGTPTLRLSGVYLAIATIERSFQKKVADIFVSFDREPVASASIAQVHFAVLKDRDGRAREVAVKVRPVPDLTCPMP